MQQTWRNTLRRHESTAERYYKRLFLGILCRKLHNLLHRRADFNTNFNKVLFTSKNTKNQLVCKKCKNAKFCGKSAKIFQTLCCKAKSNFFRNAKNGSLPKPNFHFSICSLYVFLFRSLLLFSTHSNNRNLPSRQLIFSRFQNFVFGRILLFFLDGVLFFVVTVPLLFTQNFDYYNSSVAFCLKIHSLQQFHCFHRNYICCNCSVAFQNLHWFVSMHANFHSAPILTT